MSWLPNPFKSPQHDAVSNPSHVAGVRQDLSVLSHTIGRQLRGVAAFLAPPPSPPSSPSPVAPPSDSSSSSSASSSPTLRGIRNDLAEIGGSFKSRLKTFSNLFQSQRGDADDESLEDYDGVAGITEEVLHFVTRLSVRPECWTDFPSAVDNDFFMTDFQREHASTIERLAPSLADLRLELCNYMSDGQFWMIYFILLLPRLNEHDSKLLSTHKIVEARDLLLLKLQNNRDAKANSENSMVDSSEGSSKVRTLGEDSPSQEKEVLSQSVSVAHEIDKDKQEGTEQWLEEEDTDTGNSVGAMKRLENEDDVSFSDLEDDDNDLSQRLSGLRLTRGIRVSSPNGSNEWVKLNENCATHGQQRTGQSTERAGDSEGEESNDWLTVDFDSDSLGAV